MSNLTIHLDIRLELQLMFFSDMLANIVIFIKSVKGYGA
jgi:hypothetical protein